MENRVHFLKISLKYHINNTVSLINEVLKGWETWAIRTVTRNIAWLTLGFLTVPVFDGDLIRKPNIKLGEDS